jgi:hypothetical protein
MWVVGLVKVAAAAAAAVFSENRTLATENSGYG